MGYEATSDGTLRVLIADVDAVWAGLLAGYPLAEQHSQYSNDIGTGELRSVEKIASTVVSELGTYDPTSSYAVTQHAETFEVAVWSGGKLGDADVVLKVLAELGVTGEIDAVGEDHHKWRWRLRDGALAEENGRVVYGEDVDSGIWVAQLCVGGAGFDRIAVTCGEQAAHAQVSAWCHQYSRGAGQGQSEVNAHISGDAFVLPEWATALGWRARVLPVGGGLSAMDEGGKSAV